MKSNQSELQNSMGRVAVYGLMPVGRFVEPASLAPCPYWIAIKHPHELGELK